MLSIVSHINPSLPLPPKKMTNTTPRTFHQDAVRIPDSGAEQSGKQSQICYNSMANRGAIVIRHFVQEGWHI